MGMMFQGVQFSYHREVVLVDFSLTLEPGHFAVVVGPNGAGKTTFMRLAAGLLSPDKGSVTIDGENCVTAQKKGRIHLVPQIYNKNAAQFPVTVEELVGLLLRTGPFLSKKERKARIEEALHLVDMTEYATRRIGDLSGGEQQRVMIAQALARNVEILLLDEPTSGIDFRGGEAILDLLRRLRAEKNILIIMVTHDIVKAMEYADQVICINRDICYFGDCKGYVDTHLRTALGW